MKHNKFLFLRKRLSELQLRKTLDRRAAEAYNCLRQIALVMLCKGYQRVNAGEPV